MDIKNSYDWSPCPACPFTDGVICLFRKQVILPIAEYYVAKSELDHGRGFEFHVDRKWQRIRFERSRPMGRYGAYDYFCQPNSTYGRRTGESNYGCGLGDGNRALWSHCEQRIGLYDQSSTSDDYFYQPEFRNGRGPGFHAHGERD